MPPLGDSVAPRGSLFDPQGVFWRVNSEMLMTLSGSRAVLLELAHPLIAEGVARHSDFRRQRFGRLFRTLRMMVACCFGDGAKVQRELRRMAQRHGPVHGKADGKRYSAADPALRLWVWATLIDSTVVVYERLLGALTNSERESYYRDSRRLAELFDIPSEVIPGTWEEFENYVAGMLAGNVLTVGDAAREQAASLFAGAISGRAVRWASLVGIDLLPARVRRDFGLRWDEVDGRRAERMVRVCRWARRALPEFLWIWPQAARAERMAAGSVGRARHALPLQR